jgi:GTPase SAR1 family protein
VTRLGERMIVELFGPSGVGKTTLSHALASALRDNGYPVELVSSARPSEQPCNGRPDSPMARLRAHLSRATKVAGAIAASLPSSQESPLETELMSMLVTESLSTRARNRRYLLSLRNSWTDASSSERITIFDQGYLSALCSIVCRNRPLSRAMSSVLERLPKPHILVCVDAPASVVEARLRTRLSELGPIGRMLELDVTTTLRQVAIAAELRTELARRKEVALIYCSGSGLPPSVAQTIVDQIEALPSVQHLLPKEEGYHEPSRAPENRELHNLSVCH